ncbi:RIP metalloprotease [Micromonospora sp. U21]|nr:RIP metalloprotease [Micromonospora sp. U21]
MDPPSAAAQLGLRRGDVITAIDGRPLRGWDTMSAAVRASGGRQVEVAFVRDGQPRTAAVTLPLAERVRLDVVRDPTRTIEDITPADLEQVGILGVTPIVPTSTAGPVAAVGRAADQTGVMFFNTVDSLQRVPEKIPALWAAVTGVERDPETPISVVGASRIGGELSDRGEWPTFLLLLAALNFFIGVFNLLPLLPVDGGHIAIAWFERARSLLYARLGRPDPGRVDYLKLMPLTYAVILIFAGFTLLTLVADIINPITLPD